MEPKTELEIIYDRNVKGLTYRSLAKKYRISCMQIHRMVMSRRKKWEKPEEHRPAVLAIPDEIDALKEELRKARLTIELQDLMIDISSKELGIDLRKKHGTRRSK